MKKLLSAMSIVLGLGLATAQQVAPAASKTHQTVKTVKATTAPATKPSATVKAATATPPPAAKMKKDGTPDKRYKGNKNLKKDGTPDKRYKANK
ncbi:hypothetical protein QFZ37_000301 [Chryseobacterium ginsenosidimutans]|uniref:hypothetical protein n=1 Tax=Chryseobacterium ginsenosidimutans TaxID=687846 RepID=UPI00277DFBF6|nr:hypothetical protein [Chryseobacterium ginsenosidimutans]MDQ0591932.1 hypothetical protein [Chryseobacterium ginsenosidimutans]